MRFFKNTLNFDITYYNSDTRNQTFAAPLPASSGYTAVNIQAGSVQNQGIEMALGYKMNGVILVGPVILLLLIIKIKSKGWQMV